MFVAAGTEGFESADLGLNVVCLQVEVHSLFVSLGVGGSLQEDAHLKVLAAAST